YFFSSIYFLVYMTSFSLNFLFLTTMYQHGRASVTIPLFNSINFLGTIVAGNLLFSEPLNAISWVGVIMMIVGILLASKIEKAIHEPKAAGGEQEKNMESP
nr:hypothetical protein [Candidatus Sigynarchaeota archaeon]